MQGAIIGTPRSIAAANAQQQEALRASQALEDAKRAHPTDPRVYQQLARIHRSSGDQVAQLDCLQEGHPFGLGPLAPSLL